MLGAALSLQMKNGFTPEKLEHWANVYYHDNIRFLDSEVRLILQDLMSITSGPEFEMSEKEIIDLITKLNK